MGGKACKIGVRVAPGRFPVKEKPPRRPADRLPGESMLKRLACRAQALNIKGLRHWPPVRAENRFAVAMVEQIWNSNPAPSR
ncbi:hypothetical protein C4K26_5733 [Pseudomonas chlororaphis]|nr:hypothetical protein C4K26_5733 [Pseudomonas chlororaphis]